MSMGLYTVAVKPQMSTLGPSSQLILMISSWSYLFRAGLWRASVGFWEQLVSVFDSPTPTCQRSAMSRLNSTSTVKWNVHLYA